MGIVSKQVFIEEMQEVLRIAKKAGKRFDMPVRRFYDNHLGRLEARIRDLKYDFDTDPIRIEYCIQDMRVAINYAYRLINVYISDYSTQYVQNGVEIDMEWFEAEEKKYRAAGKVLDAVVAAAEHVNEIGHPLHNPYLDESLLDGLEKKEKH